VENEFFTNGEILMSMEAAQILSSPQTVWDNVLEIIKENINARSFETWFTPLKIVDIEGNTIKISVPDGFFSEWIDKHYNTLIQNALLQTLGETKKVDYIIENKKKGGSPYQNSDWQQPSIAAHNSPVISATGSSSPYYTRLNENYRFENFITGDSNHFAYAAAKAVGDSPGKTDYNPLIIYGRTGLGKTHLLQAIGNHALSKNPNLKVYYASSESFTSHFITAIQHKKINQFSAFYRSCDILLLDDIQFFSNKGKTQEEFFHTFNDLQQNGKQIILTSDRPINELTDLEDRMISRFKFGLIVDVRPPDFETRFAILRNKCDENQLNIPGDVIEYLAVNLTFNVRELLGALTKIMARITLTSAEPTLELARTIVSEIAKPDKSILSIDQIMEYTAKVFEVPIDQLRAKTRKKDIVKARQTAMYLAKQLTDHSLITIGLHFGGRDHSTVIHSIENVEKAMKTDTIFMQKIKSMKKHLEYNR
jgi:chromosomal replication initiator protein